MLGERDGVPEPSRELALTRGGRPVSAERKRLIDAFGGGYSAPATERYLNETLARLVPASQTPSEPYRVAILDSPVVTRGLLALANDGSEVAAVMAHEIAHVTAHHAAQRAELEKTAALFTRVSSQVLDRPQEGARLRARRIGVVRRTHEQGHKVRPPRQTAEATPLEPG